MHKRARQTHRLKGNRKMIIKRDWRSWVC